MMTRYAIKHIEGGELAERVVHQAMHKHGPDLRADLAEWLRAHSDPLDPVTVILAGEGQPGLCKIGPRSNLVDYAREYRQTERNLPFETCVEGLARAPSVPVGSIDVIVSTPHMVAVLQATPLPRISS